MDKTNKIIGKSKFKLLKEEFEQYKLESIKWGIEDFINTASHIDYKISKEEVQSALEKMIYDHDSNNGINWNTIDYYVRKFGTPKKNRK